MRTYNRLAKCIIVSSSIILSSFIGCSEDTPVEPPPSTSIDIIVRSSNDSSSIANANVVLYNANNGEAVSRGFTIAGGHSAFENVNSGNYFVRISAQGFNESPPGSISPVPFSVSTGQTHTRIYYLDILQGTFGKIDGKVNPNLPGFLIVANLITSTSEHHTYSGPDGYFVLFNVPYGTYQVNALKSGYQSTNQPQVTLSSTSSSVNIQVTVNQVTGSILTGNVTFLAVENGIVNISLLDEESLSVVNGLTTMIDMDKNYSVNKIPSGNYIAWASYDNDNYVMDPDWIFKNPGALRISFSLDTTKILDFSVTGAITIISPTNPPDSIIPDLADSVVPTFNWNVYPAAKEYIIEVRDISGNLIWGGFTETGEIRHSQIPKEWSSVEFNFDGSASSELQSGNIYQWRLYADDDATSNVQTLLSSSENLMGLFFIQ